MIKRPMPAAVDRIRIRTPPTPEEAERMAKLYVSAFADASYCPETGAYGYAFWVKWGHPAETHLDTGSGLCKSSYEAELAGCMAAVEFIKTLDVTDKIIVLQCDNIQAVDTMRAHLAKLKELKAVKDAYPKHVKGHVANSRGGARHYMNNVCDRKAKEAMRSFRSSL